MQPNSDAARQPSPLRAGRFRAPRAMFALPLLLLVIVFAAARCYPANTRVIVFVQGLYTTYDESGTQETVVEGQRFNVLKNGFLARGYPRSSLLDFSYNGGAVTSSGAWQPSPYACEDTDRRATDNLVPLEQMLRDYRSRHKDAHFALVGHSLGGYVSFLEGAREAARSEADKLGVDVIVTVDAPLKGVSPDKKTLIDIIPCDKTYIAGAEIVAQKFDAATATLRADQASMMSRQGIRLATLGNDWDCLWNTGHCLPGGTWVDDRDTQFLPGAAAVSTAYQVDAAPLLSHDAILADPAAVHDAVTFVGAP